MLSIPADKANKLPFAGSFSNPSFLPTISYNFFDPTLPSLGVHG